MLTVPRHNIVDAHANKSGVIDLLNFKPRTPGLIGKEDAKDERDTLVAKHKTWKQCTNHR